MNENCFGNYIYKLREKKKLTQDQLGKMVGVSDSTVSDWENGIAYPPADLMSPIANALGVTLANLYEVIAEDQMPKTKFRILLEWMVHHFLIIDLVCVVLAIVPYVLFAIFSTVEDKASLLAVIPIIAATVYVMFFVGLNLCKKNPFVSSKALDGYTLFFLCIMVFGYFSTLPYMILDFPNGFSPSTCIPPIGVIAILHGLKKRYDR